MGDDDKERRGKGALFQQGPPDQEPLLTYTLDLEDVVRTGGRLPTISGEMRKTFERPQAGE